MALSVTPVHDLPRQRRFPHRLTPDPQRQLPASLRIRHPPVPQIHPPPVYRPRHDCHLHGPLSRHRGTWTSSLHSTRSTWDSRTTTPLPLPSVSRFTTITSRFPPSAMTFAPPPHHRPGHQRRKTSSALHSASRAPATPSSKTLALKQHRACSQIGVL